MPQRVLTGLAVLSLGVAAIAGVVIAPTSVSAAPARDAAAACRSLDEADRLERFGLTRGECVNILKGPASERSNNFIVGLCSYSFAPALTGTTNRGQCIQVLRSLGTS